MAAAMLDRELTRRHIDAQVRSAGTSAVPGIPATSEAIAVMQTDGYDLSMHQSRPVEMTDLERADVIVTMTRAQLRELATRSPTVFPRLFTVKELARRANDHPPRQEDEDVRAWVARLGAGRRTTDLLGDDPLDDVVDPIGSPIETYMSVAAELAAAITAVADAGWRPALDGV
jgi:protein-tyrosine phosphatase